MNGTQKGAGDVVVEYQRYFGPVFGWFPPGAVEWPAWTTGNGHPFPAASELIASSVTNNDVWEVETGPTKDPEGWEYATRFKLFDHSRLRAERSLCSVSELRQARKHGKGDWVVIQGLSVDQEGWEYGMWFKQLGVHREGGRSSKRGTDMVRRRMWERARGPVKAPAYPPPEKQESMAKLGPIRCVVFGCPSVFDAVLSRRLGELGVVGVVLGHDVVPRMSVASMAACIQELARHGLVRRTGAAAAELFSALGQLVKRVSESVEESAGQMARRVEEGAENVVKKVEEGAEQVARSLNISAASSQTRMAWHAQLREEADEAALKEPQECRPRATFHSMSHQPPGCEHRGDTDPTAGKPGEPVMTSVSGEEASEMCIGAQTQEVRMYPPGRVMWLVRDEAPGRAGHVIVEMHPASFTRMTISNWSFTDHVPDNYMAALRFCAAPPLAAAENSAAQTSELALARDGCGSASGSSGEGSDGEDSSGMLSPGAMFGHWDLTVPFMPATRARTVTLQELSLVWEMQRYYGLMEWPAWSNDEGEALPAEIHNSILSGALAALQAALTGPNTENMWEEAGADEVHNEPGAILVSDLGLYEAASEDDKVAEGVEKRGNREVPAGNEESTISMPVSSGNGSEVRMYPPGRVMWLVDVTEDELSEGTGHVIVEMHRKSFTRMTISGRSITDHVPDKYMNALRHCATALPPAEGMGMEASPQKAL
eukprot:gene3007-3824_t